MTTEPTRIVGYATAAITAIITLLVSFNIDISDSQQKAILGVVVAFAPIVIFAVEFTRSKVTPAATAVPKAVAETKIDQAFVATPGIDPKPTIS